jgi:protein-L-isoaspartate O-methyltransferase
MIGSHSRARRAARRIHRAFCQRPGAEHIATRAAIAGLIRWLERKHPQRVLEVGAGIGTLTWALVETLSGQRGDDGFTLYTIEDNRFCLGELRQNLQPMWGRFTVIDSVGDLGSSAAGFDFLIVDGGRQDDESLFRRLRSGAVVFIEGDRRTQADCLERALGDRPYAKADVRVLRRRILPNGTRAWDGGYRVYQLDPSLGGRCRLALINLRTKLVYRLRRLF